MVVQKAAGVLEYIFEIRHDLFRLFIVRVVKRGEGRRRGRGRKRF